MTVAFVEGKNSVFNVECNGETVFDRASEGRFPMYHELPLRIFRRFLSAEHLIDESQAKWNQILKAKGLTWDQVFLKTGAETRCQNEK